MYSKKHKKKIIFLFFIEKDYLLPRITLSRNEISAITNNKCIIHHTLYPKNPIAHHITRITAIIYKRFPMVQQRE